MIGPCNSADNYNKRNTITDYFLSKKMYLFKLDFSKFLHSFFLVNSFINSTFHMLVL